MAIFFLTHQCLHYSPYIKNWTASNSKKNITTFLIGGTLYVFLLSFLQGTNYREVIERHFILFTLKNWFLWLLIIDITAMAVVYKNFYGNSILEEIPQTWNIDGSIKKAIDIYKNSNAAKNDYKTSNGKKLSEHKNNFEKSDNLQLKDTQNEPERESYLPGEGASQSALGEAYNTTVDDEVSSEQSAKNECRED